MPPHLYTIRYNSFGRLLRVHTCTCYIYIVARALSRCVLWLSNYWYLAYSNGVYIIVCSTTQAYNWYNSLENRHCLGIGACHVICVHVSKYYVNRWNWETYHCPIIPGWTFHMLCDLSNFVLMFNPLSRNLARII